MQRRFILFSILLLTQSVALAVSPVTIKQFAVPPKIDGVPDDPCWNEDGWRGGFTSLFSGQNVTSDKTWFQIGYDKDNLYLAVRCNRKGMETIPANKLPRDSSLWTHESAEFFFSPSFDGNCYYQVILNPWGSLYDTKCTVNAGMIEHDKNWNPAVNLKTKITKDRWEAELAIPWNQIDLSQAGEGAWGYNVCRNIRRKKTSVSAYAPLADPHDMKAFAKMILPERVTRPYRWRFHPPERIDVSRHGDAYQMRGINFLVVNTTGKHQSDMTVRARLIDADGKSTSRNMPFERVANGIKYPRRFSVDIPASGLGEHTLELSVFSKKSNKDDGRLLHQDRMKVNLEYSPLRLEITRPWYRNTIYATQQLKAMEGKATVQLDDDQWEKSRLDIALHKKGNPKTSISQTSISPLQPDLFFQLPTGSLETGEYILKARLLSPEKKTIAVVETPVAVVPPAENEWRINENNVLLHNGKPFLPLGYYGMAKTDKVRNAALIYTMRYYDDEKVDQILTEAYQNGIYVVMYPYPQKNKIIRPLLDMHNNADTSKEHLEAIARRVRRFRNHPGLLAWYMCDEPRATPANRKRLRQVYNLCRREDSYHPCIFLTCRHTEFGYFTGCGDINMPDPYPSFLHGGLARRPITRVTNEINSAREAGRGRVAIWVVPQAFSYGDAYDYRTKERAPTFTELRNIVYQGVVAGAKGFLAYKLSGRNRHPDMYLGYPFVYEELNHLKPFVLADDAGLAKSNNDQLLVSSRRVGGKLVIFAVNVATNKNVGKITLQGPAAKVKRWKVLSEGRTIESTNGAIRDSFDVYATHVYVTDNVSILPRTLKDVEADIQKEKAVAP